MGTAELSRQELKLPKLRRRHLLFLGFFLLALAVFASSIHHLIVLSVDHDYASHILLVLPISAFLVFLKRDEVFSDVRTNPVGGLSLGITGLGLLMAAYFVRGTSIALSLQVLALVVVWMAGFFFCYGSSAFSHARFALLFLLLLVPLPDFIVAKVTFALQAGSSDVAYRLFQFLSVPVLKDGFVLRLPLVTLKVANECSGIRSSIGLLITTLLAGEFALRRLWTKSLLVLSVLPILIFKNGIRIVTLYLLTAYVNPQFLHGWLHTSGGVVFYILGLLMLVPIIYALAKLENRKALKMSP